MTSAPRPTPPRARDRLLSGDADLDLFGDELDRLGGVLGRRVNADRESLEKGLAQLVLTLVELLRQLMERQAIRRVDQGDLTEQEEEDLGTSLMLLAEAMDELTEQFGLTADDLNLDLGPLGPLLPRDR
jgi:hypothetical protein